MFTKTKKPSAPANLPHGYDDPESPFHVPESAREFYQIDTTPPAVMGSWHDVVEATANARARRELWAEYDERNVRRADSSSPLRVTAAPLLSSEGHSEAIQNRARTILDREYASILAVVQHNARLRIASFEAEGAARDLAGREATRLAHTCPICGEFDFARRGTVEIRTLVPGQERFLGDPALRDKVPQINSCAVCAALATTAYLAAEAGKPGPDFRTPTALDAARAAIGL